MLDRRLLLQAMIERSWTGSMTIHLRRLLGMTHTMSHESPGPHNIWAETYRRRSRAPPFFETSLRAKDLLPAPGLPPVSDLLRVERKGRSKLALLLNVNCQSVGLARFKIEQCGPVFTISLDRISSLTHA